MNDIITDFSKNFNKPETEVTAAWELAKEQAKNLYADTDEEYFPYVVSLVKKNIAVDQEQKNMDGEQKTSLFTDPPETSQGMAPASPTFMSSKQEDVKDILMFFAETEYRYKFLEEFLINLSKKFPNFKEAKEVSRMLSEAIEKISGTLKEDGEGGDAGGTVTSSSFDAAPFDGGRSRKDWKRDWDSQKPKSPQCKNKKNKKKKGKFYRLVDLSGVDKD